MARNAVGLRLIHGGVNAVPKPNEACSVFSYATPPNGACKHDTEQATEQGRSLIEAYQNRTITHRKLYAALRAAYGSDTFEATRHNWENMKARTRKGYAPLDPQFASFTDFLWHLG